MRSRACTAFRERAFQHAEGEERLPVSRWGLRDGCTCGCRGAVLWRRMRACDTYRPSEPSTSSQLTPPALLGVVSSRGLSARCVVRSWTTCAPLCEIPQAAMFGAFGDAIGRCGRLALYLCSEQRRPLEAAFAPLEGSQHQRSAHV